MSFDRGLSVFLFLFGLWMLYMSFHIPKTGMLQFVGPEVVPIGVAIAFMVTSGALFIQTMRLQPMKAAGSDLPEGVEREDRVTQGLVIVGLIAFALLLQPLGFIVAASLFCIFESTLFDPRHVIRNVIVSVCFSIAVYYLFVHVLEILLPAGILRLRL